LSFIIFLGNYFIACCWNCNNRKGCCDLQVSIRSYCSLGLSLCWISLSSFRCWLLVSLLSIQRKTCPQLCLVSEHQFHHLFQRCCVSLSLKNLLPLLGLPFSIAFNRYNQTHAVLVFHLYWPTPINHSSLTWSLYCLWRITQLKFTTIKPTILTI